jgi:hypothetical protein
MIYSTALIIAPMVLGVTSALYFVMAHVMEGLKGGSGAGFSLGGGTIVPYKTSTLVLGFNLFLTVLVTLYFVSGMKEADDPRNLKIHIDRTMLVVLLIYSLATMVGGIRIS